MREIKFRGKSSIGNEWVYGSLVNNLWTKAKDDVAVCEIITGVYEGDCWEDIAQEDLCIVEVIPSTIGQFTGFKSLTGKDIYDGDELESTDDCPIKVTVTGTVSQDEYGAWVFGHGYVKDFNKICEITGNIHNKELKK